jgi:hypothetical protein
VTNYKIVTDRKTGRRNATYINVQEKMTKISFLLFQELKWIVILCGAEKRSSKKPSPLVTVVIITKYFIFTDEQVSGS